MEDAEGDVDMVLEEEGAKIEEKERIAKEELEKELRQYRIKVGVKIFFTPLVKHIFSVFSFISFSIETPPGYQYFEFLFFVIP